MLLNVMGRSLSDTLFRIVYKLYLRCVREENALKLVPQDITDGQKKKVEIREEKP